MRLTNVHNLPDVIVDAVLNDPYDPGDCDMNVTRLIKPARMVALEKKHAHELVEDVSDRIWSLLGQAVHVVLERADATAVTEERLYLERLGWRIGGKFDRFSIEDGLLQDFKVTSAYAVANGHKREWEAQMNLLAHLLRENGQVVNRLGIIAIIRDWSAHQAAGKDTYPQCQVVTLEIPMWSDERCEEYLHDRIRRHQIAGVTLPLCNDEERWSKPDQWAVVKVGGKRAVRVLDSDEDARQMVESLGDGHTIVHRPGSDIRCEKHCAVRKFCLASNC